MSISQKVKDVTMRNLRDTIFYMKMNALQDFHTCISVPLIGLRARQHKKYSRWVDKIFFLLSSLKSQHFGTKKYLFSVNKEEKPLTV